MLSMLSSLDAYYIFVHPYFPIFPPPDSHTPPVDRPKPRRQHSSSNSNDGDYSDFEPSSPVSLALSAILALIPHPEDYEWDTEESQSRRRNEAQAFAQSAIESIEIGSELVESSTSPSKALTSGRENFRRDQFHPKSPVELESVQALAMLSVYEYGQRGNIQKMRNRAGQALVAAMNMCLHERNELEDDLSEARRRAWWMTVSPNIHASYLESRVAAKTDFPKYYCVCQGSIVSGTVSERFSAIVHTPDWTNEALILPRSRSRSLFMTIASPQNIHVFRQIVR